MKSNKKKNINSAKISTTSSFQEILTKKLQMKLTLNGKKLTLSKKNLTFSKAETGVPCYIQLLEHYSKILCLRLVLVKDRTLFYKIISDSVQKNKTLMNSI